MKVNRTKRAMPSPRVRSGADAVVDLIEFSDPEPIEGPEVTSFSAKKFVHCHLKIPLGHRCVGFHQNEDLIFAFQERLCTIIDVEVKTNAGRLIRVFPTKLNEFAHRGVFVVDEEDLVQPNAKPQKRQALVKSPTRASPTRMLLQERNTRWNLTVSKGLEEHCEPPVEKSVVSRHSPARECKSPRRAGVRKGDIKRAFPLSTQESPVVSRIASKQKPLAIALVATDANEDSP
jgi:hypothetical protein